MYTINTQKVYGTSFTNGKFNTMIQRRHSDFLKHASLAMLKAINKLGKKSSTKVIDDNKPSKPKAPKVKLMNKKNK